jgi:Tol biopolymer transport system component
MYRKRLLGAAILALSATYACAEPIFITPNVSGVVSEGSNRSFDMSPDGRFVLFTADADDMALGDSNGVVDLVLMDRATNTSEVISVGFTPPQQGGVNYYTGAVSADGRYVAFTTARDRPSGGQVELAYVRDRVTQQTRLVSTNDAGEPLEESAMNVAISDDGRYVAFTSTAPSILEGQDPPRHFLVDLQTGQRRIVSRNRGGSAPSLVGTPGFFSMSGDGRWIVFSAWSLLPSVPPDTPGIYLYDSDDDSIAIVSRTADGELGQGDMEFPKISRDGRYIAFYTSAANLTGRPQHEWNFLRKDRVSGALAPIDIDDQGRQFDMRVTGVSAFTYMSATGRFIAFQSPKLLMPGLTEPLLEDPTYVRDMESNRSVVANMNLLGGRERAVGPLSGDGRFMLMSAGGPMYPPNLSVPDDKKFRVIVGDAFLQDLSPIDVRAHAAQVAGAWEVVLTVDNLSTLQATLMHVRVTSTPPSLELGVAIPDAVADDCTSRFFPVDCYIQLLPGGQQTKIKFFIISNAALASANLQFTLDTNEPDSNIANNTVNVTLVNPTPPPPPPQPPPPPAPSSGGGGGGGAFGWLEIASLAAALLLLRAWSKRVAQCRAVNRQREGRGDGRQNEEEVIRRSAAHHRSRVLRECDS